MILVVDLICVIRLGIVVYGKITPDKFVSISVPDKFELLQIYAVQRGKNIGDSISGYSTENIEGEVQNDSLTSAEKSSQSKHTLSELVNIYRNLKEKILNKAKEHDRDSTIENLERNEKHEI